MLSQIPKERPELKLLKVREEMLDTDTVLKMFRFDPKRIEQHNAPALGGYQFIMHRLGDGQKYTESITIRPHSDVMYQRDTKVYDRDSGFTEDKARRLAKRYIESHGGMPADAVLDSIVPSFYGMIKNPEGDKTVVHQYQLDYVSGKNESGYHIDGANHISIVLDSEDVIKYERFWRHPVGLVSKAQRVISAKDAVATAIDASLKHPVTTYRLPPRSFITPGRSSGFASYGGLLEASGYVAGPWAEGITNLYKMELVYFSPTPRVNTDMLRPAWKVSFASNNTVVFVDVYTGKAVNVGVEKRESEDKARVSAVKRSAKLLEEKAAELRKNLISKETNPRSPSRPNVHYFWAGEKVLPNFPSSLPIYIRDHVKMSGNEVIAIRDAFGVKERLPISKGFYKFGTAKASDLKSGRDYTLESSEQERQFTYTMVDWINWSASHPQMPSTKEAIKIATDFCRSRGLLTLEVAKVESDVQKTEYLEPDHKPVTPPVVWVRFQGKVDGYPLIDGEGRPEIFSWMQVGVGTGGKILTVTGMLPAKLEKTDHRLRSIDEAIDELNTSLGTSNSDGPIISHGGPYLPKPGVDDHPKPIKPTVIERKITDIELAYQIRVSPMKNAWYFGPVYVFTIENKAKEGPAKVTVPAARP